MLAVLDELNRRGVSFRFTIVGAPATKDDVRYEMELKKEIAARPYAAAVRYAGAMPHSRLPEVLRETDVFLNFSATGSIDKAVLEALASGVPVVTSNEAFRALLEPYRLYVSVDEPQEIASAILYAAKMDTAPLREKVIAANSLAALIQKILAAFVL